MYSVLSHSASTPVETWTHASLSWQQERLNQHRHVTPGVPWHMRKIQTVTVQTTSWFTEQHVPYTTRREIQTVTVQMTSWFTEQHAPYTTSF